MGPRASSVPKNETVELPFLNGATIVCAGAFKSIPRLDSSSLDIVDTLETLHPNSRVIQVFGVSDDPDLPMIAATHPETNTATLYSVVEKKAIQVFQMTVYKGGDFCRDSPDKGLTTIFSKGGEALVIAGGDVFRGRTGEKIMTLEASLGYAPERIHSMRCFPKMCPNSLFVCGTDYPPRSICRGVFSEYDLQYGLKKTRTFESNSYNFFDISKHLERNFLMCVSEDASVTIWDRNSAEIVSQLRMEDKGGCLTCHEDKDLIIVGQMNGGVDLWDLRNLSACLQHFELPGWMSSVEMVDEKHCVMCNLYSVVSLINCVDADPGEEVLRQANVSTKGLPFAQAATVSVLRRDTGVQNKFDVVDEVVRVRFLEKDEFHCLFMIVLIQTSLEEELHLRLPRSFFGWN